MLSIHDLLVIIYNVKRYFVNEYNFVIINQFIKPKQCNYTDIQSLTMKLGINVFYCLWFVK